MSIFGRILTDDQVEEAVLPTLQRWLPTYLSEVERQVGLEAGYYQRPAPSSYIPRTDFDTWPEEMLPVVMTVSTGLEDDPVKDGRGVYRFTWGIGIVAVVSSIDKNSSRQYAYRMAGAIRAVMIQHQSLDAALGGTVIGIDLVGSRNNELPTEDERTLWASRQLFLVHVADALTKGVGPVAPDTQPQPDPTQPWPDPPVVVSATDVLTHQ